MAVATKAVGKRNPTTHRTAAQTTAHNHGYGATKKNMEKDKMGHRLRRKMVKEGKVKKGQDVGHIKPAAKGGKHTMANVRAENRSKNRGHGMSPGGTKKGTSVRGGKRKA